MTEKSFEVEIVQPSGVSYKKQAFLVVFPATDGSRAILYNHASFLCAGGYGLLRILNQEKTWDCFFLDGGIIENRQNQMSILAQSLSSVGQLDGKEAQAALDAIEKQAITAEYTKEKKQQDLAKARALLKALGQSRKYSG